MPSEYLDEVAGKKLTGGSLFYPCAGKDTEVPIRWFSPWVRDFWFVDINYDLGDQFSNEYLLEESTYELLTGTTLRKKQPFEVAIRHETYRWSDGKPLTIHRCRGRGYDTFRVAFKDLDRRIAVFFYRGDTGAIGEGSSGFRWLKRKRLRNVLERFDADGIVVSDGSNAVNQFRRRRGLQGEVAWDPDSLAFSKISHQFHVVGYLGQRYGPTIAWQVTRLTKLTPP